MNHVNLQGQPFERGIDRITYQARDADPRTQLPARHELPPPPAAQRQHLAAALPGGPSLADALEAALRPPPLRADLLHPGRFQEALRRTQTRLREQAARQPQTGETLTAAADLLEHDMALRDLVSRYRNALFAG